MIEKFGLQRHASLDGRKYHFNASNNFATGRNFCASRIFCTSRHFLPAANFVLAGIFVPAANFALAGIFVPAAIFLLAGIFCASYKFCASKNFCASMNFCASSKFCAGSNFCASRNICVLLVLLLYVPKSTTLVMVRRSAHLITSFLGKLEETVNQYYVMGARALDPGPSGRGFEPHRRHCIVPLSKKHLS